jgi:predicted nucleic acid-binding Zn ribbon protein
MEIWYRGIGFYLEDFRKGSLSLKWKAIGDFLKYFGS